MFLFFSNTNVSQSGGPSSSSAPLDNGILLPRTETMLKEDLHSLSEHAQLLEFLLRPTNERHIAFSAMVAELHSAP